MRYVKRRAAKTRPAPRAAWDLEWRSTATSGPPRCLLSNHVDVVLRRVGRSSAVPVGSLDWLTRLYQHPLRTKTEDGVTYVVYDQDEWETFSPVATHIEAVDEIEQTVHRIPLVSAARFVRVLDGKFRPIMAIPLDFYSEQHQEHISE